MLTSNRHRPPVFCVATQHTPPRLEESRTGYMQLRCMLILHGHNLHRKVSQEVLDLLMHDGHRAQEDVGVGVQDYPACERWPNAFSNNRESIGGSHMTSLHGTARWTHVASVGRKSHHRRQTQIVQHNEAALSFSCLNWAKIMRPTVDPAATVA